MKTEHDKRREWAERTVANEDYLPWADVQKARAILGSEGVDNQRACGQLARELGNQLQPRGLQSAKVLPGEKVNHSHQSLCDWKELVKSRD